MALIRSQSPKSKLIIDGVLSLWATPIHGSESFNLYSQKGTKKVERKTAGRFEFKYNSNTGLSMIIKVFRENGKIKFLMDGPRDISIINVPWE